MCGPSRLSSLGPDEPNVLPIMRGRLDVIAAIERKQSRAIFFDDVETNAVNRPRADSVELDALAPSSERAIPAATDGDGIKTASSPYSAASSCCAFCTVCRHKVQRT